MIWLSHHRYYYTSLQPRGSHFPVEPSATRIKNFDWKKLPWSLDLIQERSLISWFFIKKALWMVVVLFKIALLSWMMPFKHSLIAWFSTNYHLDPLISFWSWLQMVLTTTNLDCGNSYQSSHFKEAYTCHQLLLYTLVHYNP